MLDDPAHFDGKSVRVVGEVWGSMGALGSGVYQINDGTGTLTMVSKGGGMPRVGAKVGVEGKFQAVFTVGAESGAVLLEERRFTP